MGQEKVRLGYVIANRPEDVMLTPCGLLTNFTCKRPGIMAEIWQSLGQMCHFQYEFAAKVYDYSQLVDFVKNGTLDASGEVIYLGDDRVKGIKVSSTVIDRPRVGFASMRAVTIFTPRVDIVCFGPGTLLSMAVVLVLLTMFEYSCNKRKAGESRISSAVFEVVRRMFFQVRTGSEFMLLLVMRDDDDNGCQAKTERQLEHLWENETCSDFFRETTYK